MGVSKRKLVQGTLEMLMLKTLALESMHRYGIALRIRQVSDGVFRVKGVAASRTEPHEAGCGNSWSMASTENNRRAKYYALTAGGRKAHDHEGRQRGRQIPAFERILED